MTHQKRGRRKPTTLGQHFLRDKNVRKAIVDSIPRDGLPIIEIGPGQGSLTQEIISLNRPLVAIELDGKLAHALQQQLRNWVSSAQPLIRVLNNDILTIEPEEVLASIGCQPPYGIVGNLPYAITAPLIRKFLSSVKVPPAWMVIMVQREVAHQITAVPGKCSLLSISAQFYAKPELLFEVTPQSFDPPPKVHSAVVHLEHRTYPPVSIPSESLFFDLVRAGFRTPRKQIHNSLSTENWIPDNNPRTWLTKNQIDPTRRAATLTLDEWARLAWAREKIANSQPSPLPGNNQRN
jgi:16S rRNA (adenine1518-N6/adenine1519-N6)-dimethyltransferase